MSKTYMVVETTNLIGSRCFSMQSTEEVENGAIVGKGKLVDNEECIYTATDDFKNGMFLVANPAWNYDDSRMVNQNEENYINEANKAFRTYELKKNDKFKIYNVDVSEAFAKDDYIEFKEKKWKKAEGNTPLQVVAVEDIGFPYFTGSYGVKITDGSGKYGYAIDTRVKKYTVEVVADPVEAGEP